MLSRLLAALAFLGLAASPAWAVTNAITPGVVTLTATFESISVTAPFTFDDNGNATAAIQYRVTGAGTWKNAYTPYIDRRGTIQSVSNPYASQARGAVVGLTANTSYDVAVTWTDSDGVTGGQPSAVTITTLSHTPPTGSGTTRNITDNTTQSSALAAMNPGDTLLWASGSYNAFTASRSGNSGAWIILDGQGVATISGLGVNQNIALNANFIILKNFILSASDFHGILVASGQHDLRITGNTVQGFSRLCANGPTTTHYGDGGIVISSAGGGGGSNDHIYVLSNSVTGHANLTGCMQNPSFNGPGTGIGFQVCTTCVFADNTIVGNGCRDALSLDDKVLLTNVDIARNTVSGYIDDGIEFKGGNLNVRAWGNLITANGNGARGINSCMSNEYTDNGPDSNPYGPSYYFRNTCKVSKIDGLCGFKGPSGPAFFFHNSLDASGQGGFENWVMNCGTDPTGSGPYQLFNNATVVPNAMIEGTPTSAVSTDYNCGVSTNAGSANYVIAWNDGTSHDYLTFAAFRSGQPAQEAHGVNSNPTFLSSALDIGSGSPCKDVGVSLANFNTRDSLWGYTGTAPDAGAFEVGGFTADSGGGSTGGRSKPSRRGLRH